ncbi:metal ABC transporter solute-binding protein, Zn/Mn family [Bifidobacterium sp.]|jgi:zinc/manganese transport system substrate-binding protein|uniref:metal ABC transporter solute-binding protein, Zn/Mn family n=1 Tax=Bifidobacterium sp. TaxID=41200 RepID=UPI0025C3AD1A|nr:zinc ABC transporter substrate-binding protein [Bifidobacterium sp.]MCH4209176.1 zinc ABC transporter substrate-binding protein [Bifidobacterium sp.]MCI1224622.1 zinc ABC transporter substrate-binding protein [Bifidobacterium sp.]
MTWKAVRKKALREFTALATAIVLTASLAACDMSSPDPKHSSASPSSSGPIAVVASIRQWGSLAEEIGGSDIALDTIVSPASDEEAQDFEPKSADTAKLQHASIVVTNGAGYDAWATKNLVKGTVTVSAAETIGALEGDNPHLWLSKDVRAGMASELAEAFSKALPTKKKSFAARLQTWQAKEKTLDDEIASFANAHGNASYAATGTAAFYLMDDMGFKDATPRGYSQALLAGQEPAPADLKGFRELLEGGSVALFVDTSGESGNAKKDTKTNNGSGTGDATNSAPGETADAVTLLRAAAKDGAVPIVDVATQMPAKTATLDDWIGSLIESIETALDATAPETSGNPGSPTQGTSSPSPAQQPASTNSSKR